MEHFSNQTKQGLQATPSFFSRHKWRILAGLGVGVVLGISGYLYTVGALPFFDRAPVLPTAHGTLYFTGATSDHPVPNVYLYDLDRGNFELGQGVFTNEAYARYTTAFSPSGREIAYFNAIAADSSGAPSEPTVLASTLQLIRFSVNDPSQFDVRTPDAPSFKIYPQWSPDGQSILYEAYVGEDGGFADINNWAVYRIDGVGKEVRIVHGSSPQWSPDGASFLYVGEDGVYRYDVATASSSMAVPLLEPAHWGATRIDLTPDGTTLVVSAETKRIERYRITAWDPFTYELNDTVNREHVRHWWPQVSRDGSQIAAIDWEQVADGDTNYQASLVVYGKATETSPYQVIASTTLSEFDLMAKYLSDWR